MKQEIFLGEINKLDKIDLVVLSCFGHVGIDYVGNLFDNNKQVIRFPPLSFFRYLKIYKNKGIKIDDSIQINKLTSKLNDQISIISGHKEYFSNLKHAAYSEGKEVLFVNRGVDISRPLSAQNDCFWWGYQNFSLINKPYYTFKRIVRGYQSNPHNDIENSKSRILCTLFRQPLENNKILAGIFSKNGEILELFESN